MSLKISSLLTEYEDHPIGLDEKAPRFSWTLQSEENNTIQRSCQIQVTEDGKVVWDTGIKNTQVSTGIAYTGDPLKPCQEYKVSVTVTDNHGNTASACTAFETGFLTGTMEGWEEAKWIGAPKYTVCARNRGVFILETQFRIAEGSKRAGVVFGANDFRLNKKSLNELGLAGENYIRYEINLSQKLPTLDIYRVGYAPEDREDIPFASSSLVNFEGEEKVPVIRDENKHDFHSLRIEVDGNNAYTYVDDILVDAEYKTTPWGTPLLTGRTLNPRGNNDVLTYPRLNEIGFFAGEKDQAYFKYLRVKNMRQPGNTFIQETPKGSLNGGKSLFADLLPVENGCFLVSGRQLTKDPSNTSVPMLRTEVNVEKNIKNARLYITARGIYECRINGQEITEQVLNPGLTQYDKRMSYQTFDITGLLKKGRNGLGVTLSSGWWSDAQTFVVRNYNYFGDKEALLAKLVVTYEDGTRDVRVTDTHNWKYYSQGPYTYAGFFAGECFDGRKADIYENYSLPDYDCSSWEDPVEVKPESIEESRTFPGGFGREWPALDYEAPKLLGEYCAPVFITDRRAACERKKLEEGVYLYDLGQEMAGVPRIILREEAGTEVIIRYAEVLYPDLPEYAKNVGRMMLENYRDATSTDFYICSGKGDEVYQPKFTFHGYRYIEISNVKNPPEPEEVVSLQYSSIKDFKGTFESSNDLLNRFAQNVRWSQKCNFINIPTDCPQRNERMGWAGDTHVFCHTALHNADLKLFYERNLQAMADLQTKEGQFPAIAPVGGGFGGLTYECASTFIAWELYQHYGDVRTLEKFYPGMKKYAAYIKGKGLEKGGDFASLGMLGDWLAPEETDLSLIGNAFYYRILYLMGKMAGILGLTKEQEEYEALAQSVKKFWNETFLDLDTGKTCGMDGKICDTQCSYVLGLEYGIITDIQSAGEHLARKVKDKDYTVGTGFFGTGLLNPALTHVGKTSEAYKLLLQTNCPSWLYPVTQGATSIWEHWDSYTKEKGFGGQNSMNSFNHYSLGSVLSWMYHVILGIQRDENTPGFTHFILKPEMGPLEFASGTVVVPQGVIRAGWKKIENQVEYTCSVPVNTTAELFLPDGRKETLGSGTYTFKWNYNEK